MAITLSDEESRALCTALDNYLPELRYEVARIKHERDRHELAMLEETLTRIQRRLSQT